MALSPKFLYNTALFDGATITSNSEASGLPATNLQDLVVQRVYRTAGTTQLAYVVFDLGSTILVNMAAVFGHNLTAGLTLQGNSADSWGSPPYNVGLTIIRDIDSQRIEKAVTFASGSYRFWRLTIQDTANTAAYWQIGRFVAGTAFSPAQPFDLAGASRTDTDPSIIDEAESQTPYSRQRAMIRAYRVNFSNIDTYVDHQNFYAMYRLKGNRLPFAACFNPDDATFYAQDTIYGVLTQPMAQALAIMRYGDLSIAMREVW